MQAKKAENDEEKSCLMAEGHVLLCNTWETLNLEKMKLSWKLHAKKHISGKHSWRRRSCGENNGGMRELTLLLYNKYFFREAVALPAWKY